MDDVRAFVVEAALALQHDVDPASVGATVTADLCGHWEHEGPCRWPHNSAIDAERDPAAFRTIFIAGDAEEAVVRDRIEGALRRAPGWRVISTTPRSVAEGERELAARLIAGPRATGPVG